MRALVYNLYAHICARIIIKFETLAHKIVIGHHIKFYEAPSFRLAQLSPSLFLFNVTTLVSHPPLHYCQVWRILRWRLLGLISILYTQYQQIYE